LASVLKGQAPAALLDSYHHERHALAERNTGYARQFADSIGLFEAVPELEDNSPQGESARAVASDYLNGHVRREFNIPGVTFGGRYDGSPIIVSDGTTAPPDAANSYTPCATPGGRPPHAWLSDGRSLFDTFHTEWTLLVLGPDRVDTSAFESVAASMGVDLRAVHHTHPEILELYQAPLVLIRPDQIVAWRGHGGEPVQPILAKVMGSGDTVQGPTTDPDLPA
jgi:hypothetical protein